MTENPSIRICPKCGAEIPHDSVFCLRCGLQLSIPNTYPPSPSFQVPQYIPPQMQYGGAPAYGPYPPPYGAYPPLYYMEDPAKKASNIASAISIVTTLLCLFLPVILAMPFLVFAIIAAIYAIIRKPSCLSVSGLIIAVIIFLLLQIALAILS